MDAAKIAGMVLRNLQKLHRPVHEYRVVDGSRFSHVNQSFYRGVEDQLARLGFSILGDIEDVTVAKYGRPAPRTFIRVMTDVNRRTMAGFFHIAPIWLWRMAIWAFGFPTKIIEFKSRSKDGSWATTTNVTQTVQQPRPENMLIDFAPRSLSAEQLYVRHRQTLAGSNRSYQQITTIEDVIQLEIEQHAKKREFLVSIGWVTPEYLAAQGIPASHVDAVYAESQRLLNAGFDALKDS